MPASVVFFFWWTPVTRGTNIPALNDLLIPFGVAFGDKILNGAFSIDGEHGRYAAGTDTVRFSAGGYVHAFHFFHAINHSLHIVVSVAPLRAIFTLPIPTTYL